MNPRLSENDLNRVLKILERASTCLEIPINRSAVNLVDLVEAGDQDWVALLSRAATHAGLIMRPVELEAGEIGDVLSEDMLVLCVFGENDCWLLESISGSTILANQFKDSMEAKSLTPPQLGEMLSKNKSRTFVVTREFACESISNIKKHNGEHTIGLHHHDDHHHDDHHHISPFFRFLSILRLDQRDIWTVVLFALVNGILSLASPLAVEALVNVVSWGTYFQPLLVLGLILLVCLALAAVLNILQGLVVEIIQRRQFVRFVSDLAHRFPRAKQKDLEGIHAREYANRVFDVMTIQKSLSSILLEGISIILAVVLGMTLLAFYHPFLLGFDLVLLFSMIGITWLLGRGGIDTAIEESITKYRVAHWLQDVLSSPAAFKINGGESLAIEQANRLTTQYVLDRKKQFRVVIRQFAFAAGLQAIASTAILGLGGWLVIQQQLTLGQLVASELVVTVVVGAFSKASKLFEKYYDLMAAIDKVGHLLDISVDPRQAIGEVQDKPAEVHWGDLSLAHTHVSPTHIASGRRVAVTGRNALARSVLLKSVSGLSTPEHGGIEINGIEAMQVALSGRAIVAVAGSIEMIHASLATNISLARTSVGLSHIREAIDKTGLSHIVSELHHGLDTVLQSDGQPLSLAAQAQVMIARAIVAKPKLLVIDGLLDLLPGDIRQEVWARISDPSNPWTLILGTNDPQLVTSCDDVIELS